MLNPKPGEKQVSQESQQKRRQDYDLYFEAKEKNFSFSKDKHLQGKFALGNKLCDKIISQLLNIYICLCKQLASKN